MENNKLYWSDEVYRIFGLAPQEFGATYEAFLKYVHPDDHELVNKAYSDSVTNISSYEIVHRVVTKDGKIKYVEERCDHEVDISGKVIKSIGTVHDITQRREYEKKLEVSSNVFKYSTDAMIITNEKNKIITINKAFEKLTGYSINEAKGKNPRFLSSGWGDKEFYDQMWNDINTTGVWAGEVRDRKKTGEIYISKTTIIAVKDINGKVLNYIGISHDITVAKEKEKTIQQLAYYDFLTNLPNRKLFEEEVNSFIKSSHYNHKNFALLFLDLDNFKWINDSLGHYFGDKVLIEVSKIINGILNEDSIFARLGGDEFILLVPYENILIISQLATNIIENIKEPLFIENKEINIGCSIGISLFPQNGETYEKLLKNSDIAMYGAKDTGKNNFKYFSDDMNEKAKRRLELDNKLRRAVNEDQFTLFYQPKVSCSAQNIIGFEALIRWNDEELGFISPVEFIPLAEQSGYIYDIGLWVLKQAFTDLNIIFEKNKSKKYHMAINVSGKQIEDARFIDDVQKLIDETKIDTSFIEFEITETSIMDNIENVIPVLDQIRSLGIKISIDDFGTGYSSMAYLKKMPINKLKIDREFIIDLENSEEDKAIVEATIALAKSLKLDTIAEGVEFDSQLNILKSIGCDVFQGYYFSKPVDLKKLLEMV